jgi:error-prone DNA polymerase
MISPNLPDYAELHALSNFSFQRGASHPEELVARAHALGYSAIALTDECSVAGVVRAHQEAKKLGVHLLLGAELGLMGFRLVVLVRNLEGWGNLCEFITTARMTADKGHYTVRQHGTDFSGLQHCEILFVPERSRFASMGAALIESGLRWALQQFCHPTQALSLAVELHQALDDDLWLHTLTHVAQRLGVHMVAAGDVHMHIRSRKPLQDVITAVQQGKPVQDCGFVLQANAERHLRSRMRLAQLYPAALLATSVAIASRCTFSLDEIRYQYPMETVPAGSTPAQTLARLTWEGASQRYPAGIPATVQAQVHHELTLIAELSYEMYFLTVHDMVRFARSRNILCQGRGSAANSTVCYCLGVTEVDPDRMATLFERFISRERNEPPDIDIDFEHQRREEVIQYIYQKYGRDRAALTAVVVSYRPRSAIRDVGKALGIAEPLVDRFAKEHHWFDGKTLMADKLAHLSTAMCAQGLAPVPLERLQQWLVLSQQLMGFPRHLSQHVGGFVLTRSKLTRLVPVENAAMPDRSIIQWDKDDLDAMGLLKVDVLALGMLSAIRRCLALVSQSRGYIFQMQDIPSEDPATYDMICKADTVGVFQIESRAQMSMLPRLLPRCFYDLVIEVAIVRPGPIQGGMVHPYLRRRQGIEAVLYPSQALRDALSRTLGVPIFQEQVMQIAMSAAGFSADEADSLRRSMAAWKRKGGVNKFYDRIVNGMTERGYTLEFAQTIFRQIEGFGEYGFPESHAASFALLVYASCWLKHHEPAAFLAAMVNSQPLGFYSSDQLVQDAKRHHIKVLPPDVLYSDWDCTLVGPVTLHHTQDTPTHAFSRRPQPAVRLGLCLVHGLQATVAQRIMEARHTRRFSNTEDLALRAQLGAGELKALASADALQSLAGHRRQQVWEASALHSAPVLLKEAPINEDWLDLPAAPEGEEIVFDYAATGLTLRRHPLAVLRPRLAALKLETAAQLQTYPHGKLVRTCGIVVMRQQPPTAKGVVFVTLEDETGNINVIVWKKLREKQRDTLLKSRLLVVYGQWQRDEDANGQRSGQVCHLIAGYLKDMTPWLGRLAEEGRSRDFR